MSQPETNNEKTLSRANVLMIGTGYVRGMLLCPKKYHGSSSHFRHHQKREYTTGYVGGQAADSDKGAGVVALTMFDLRRRGKVSRLGMCGVNVGANENLEQFGVVLRLTPKNPFLTSCWIRISGEEVSWHPSAYATVHRRCLRRDGPHMRDLSRGYGNQSRGV
jgi:hypothetical protein